MSDEQPTPEVPNVVPPTEAPAPAEPVEETPDLLDRASEVADRLEKANAQTEKLIKQQQRLHVEKTLSGSADAGNQPKALTPDQVTTEEAKKFLKGTGYEGMLDKEDA